MENNNVIKVYKRMDEPIDVGTTVKFYGTDLTIVEVTSEGIMLENNVFVPYHLLFVSVDDSDDEIMVYNYV
jgi:hypothetical protein